MADLQKFSITLQSPALLSVLMPRMVVECQVIDSATGAVIADYTGANAIRFPNDLTTLMPSADDRRQFAELIVMFLVEHKRTQS